MSWDFLTTTDEVNNVTWWLWSCHTLGYIRWFSQTKCWMWEKRVSVMTWGIVTRVKSLWAEDWVRHWQVRIHMVTPVHLQSIYNEQTNIRTRSWSNGGRSKSPIFFHMMWVAGYVCTVSLGKRCTRMDCGKKMSRWRECDALSNVLLGNPYSCHFDMYSQPEHRCRPCTPIHGNGKLQC